MAFKLTDYLGQKFKNVQKDPTAIREAAQAILDQQDFFGSVGNTAPVDWAQTAIQQLDSYDARIAGKASRTDQKGRDLAEYELDKAYSWITGAAQPHKAARVLE